MNTAAETIVRGKRYRVRARILLWLGFIGFFTIAPVVQFAPHFYDSIAPHVFWWWAVPCWVMVAAAGLYLHNAKCPRCGDRFAVGAGGYVWNDFADRCLNCGLSLRGDEA